MWIMVVLFLLNGAAYFTVDDDAVFSSQAECEVMLEKLEKVEGLPAGATDVEVECIPNHNNGNPGKEHKV